MAAQPAEPNAVMEAWMTVLITGVFAQGGERQSNYCFHYSLNFEPGLPLRGLQGFAGNYIITGGYEMRKAFMCSLCYNGIVGGGLYLDNQAVTFRTQKLTVSEKFKNLTLPLHEIKAISWKWLVFPVATFHMKNSECYKIIIFNKWRFIKATPHNYCRSIAQLFFRQIV